MPSPKSRPQKRSRSVASPVRSKKSKTENRQSASKLKKRPWTPEEDQALIGIVEDSEATQTVHQGKRRIKWKLVSHRLHALNGNDRSGKQCRERWFNHLRSDVNTQSKWTIEEERKLVDLQRKYGNRWTKIAILIGRFEANVKNKWYSPAFAKKLSRGKFESVSDELEEDEKDEEEHSEEEREEDEKEVEESSPPETVSGDTKPSAVGNLGLRPWTKEDDQALIDIVENLDPIYVSPKRGIKWPVVAAALDRGSTPRAARQCRERWRDHLRPKRPWTIEEERKLVALQSEFGNKWNSISVRLNRYSMNVKNHWYEKGFAKKRKMGMFDESDEEEDGESDNGEEEDDEPDGEVDEDKNCGTNSNSTMHPIEGLHYYLAKTEQTLSSVKAENVRLKLQVQRLLEEKKNWLAENCEAGEDERRQPNEQNDSIEERSSVKDDSKEWDNMLKRLDRFKRKKNHLDVTVFQDRTLFVWMNRQRQLGKSQRLDDDRKLALDELGFDWEQAVE